MVLVDADRRYVEVNAAFVELLKTRRKELIGRYVYEHVVDGPVMSAAEWRVALDGDEFSGVAVLSATPSTRRRPVTVSGLPANWTVTPVPSARLSTATPENSSSARASRHSAGDISGPSTTCSYT